MSILEIGVDLVRINRIERVLRRYGALFTRRAFHVAEVRAAYALSCLAENGKRRHIQDRSNVKFSKIRQTVDRWHAAAIPSDHGGIARAVVHEAYALSGTDAAQYSQRAVEYLSARWAAKEALYKALYSYVPVPPFHDIAVLSAADALPLVDFDTEQEPTENSTATKNLHHNSSSPHRLSRHTHINNRKPTFYFAHSPLAQHHSLRLSMSHDTDYATATVLLLESTL